MLLGIQQQLTHFGAGFACRVVNRASVSAVPLLTVGMFVADIVPPASDEAVGYKVWRRGCRRLVNLADEMGCER